MVGDRAGMVKFWAASAAADVRSPLAVASCCNLRVASRADKRLAAAKDAMMAISGTQLG